MVTMVSVCVRHSLKSVAVISVWMVCITSETTTTLAVRTVNVMWVAPWITTVSSPQASAIADLEWVGELVRSK